MTYPAGVQLSTLTFSNPTTFLGNQATRTEVTVQASAGVVWAATGEPIDDFAETVTPDAGLPGYLTVPFVDQPGFTDQSGNAFTMWAYTVTRRTFFGSSMKVVQKNWQPVVGQSNMDFDNLPGGNIGLPVSAPIVPVTSVAGETGVVRADSLADALSEYLPIPDVSGKLDASTADITYAAKSVETTKLNATERGAASGVAPLDATSRIPDANLPQRLQDADLATKIDGRVTPLVNSAVPPAVSSYIASDPSVVNSAATMAASNAGLLPKWKANTAYTAGQQVASPNGDIVSAKVNFTSGATYSAANWNPAAQQAINSVRLENGAWIWDLANATHYVVPDNTGALIVRATARPVPGSTPILNW